MSKYDAVPHPMIRIPRDDEAGTPARNIIIDDDTNTVLWSEDDGSFHNVAGTVQDWREAVEDVNADQVDWDEVEVFVQSNLSEPELCLQFLSELKEV